MVALRDRMALGVQRDRIVDTLTRCLDERLLAASGGAAAAGGSPLSRICGISERTVRKENAIARQEKSWHTRVETRVDF